MLRPMYSIQPTPKGKRTGQPLDPDATGSRFFRIPALLTLNNGWLLAASDIRWRTSGDSPANLDTIVSLSRDNGVTWDWEVVNYFSDMADTENGPESASFIDPALLQSEDGRIHMLVDACPSRVGLARGGRFGYECTGFDARGRLLVARSLPGTDAPAERQSYSYYVDRDLERVCGTGEGRTLHLHPICEASGTMAGIWVDAWLNLYEEHGSVLAPLYCPQLYSQGQVPCNLFYRNSPWKVYPTMFTMYRTASVTEDGLVWEDPRFLNIKCTNTEAFTGVCPGRGLSFFHKGTERLLFAVYDNDTGTELASVVYSDDGGKTWRRGQRQKPENLNGVGKTSESQVVVLPDGRLRMYSRNLADQVSYADSEDGGETWGICQRDLALFSKCRSGGCMVSFVNLKGTLEGPDGRQYSHLLLASYSRIQRTEGAVRIGAMDVQSNVTWLNGDVSRYGPGSFEYSCVTQLPDTGEFAILYEFGELTPHSSTLVFQRFTAEDLLGPGWRWRPCP